MRGSESRDDVHSLLRHGGSDEGDLELEEPSTRNCCCRLVVAVAAGLAVALFAGLQLTEGDVRDTAAGRTTLKWRRTPTAHAVRPRSCWYTPSEMEREWARNTSVEGRICSLAHTPSQIDAARHWLTYAAAATGPQPRLTPTATEARSISRYECSDGSVVGHIEPLTGFARHPR